MQICKERYILWGVELTPPLNVEKFWIFNCLVIQIRANIFFFYQNICQLMFEKKHFSGGWVQTKSVKFHIGSLIVSTPDPGFIKTCLGKAYRALKKFVWGGVVGWSV